MLGLEHLAGSLVLTWLVELVYVYNVTVLYFGGDPHYIGIILALICGCPGDVFFDECCQAIIFTIGVAS